MINEESHRKLREMSLEEMVNAPDIQAGDPQYTNLSFDDRLKMLVDYTYQAKYTSKVKRLMKMARFRIPSADLHDVYYVDRHLDREMILGLSSCQFISNSENVVFQGFTGSGKSYLACALGKEACKQGIRTRYIRLPDLLTEWEEAKLEPHGVTKLLKRSSGYRLLILDEWLIQIPTEEQLHFLFELIERRYDEGSTIFCTQYKKENWHERLSGGILADSILDRVIHRTSWVYSGDLNMRELLAKREQLKV